MPQITKLRIVNFQYNEGKRLIADELYHFSSGNQSASDVLINLANGGGKSVLVQLMMQPVIPKAKVAGRRIESFFTKASDHCYVVLEWALDHSPMRLMTGIAMSASDMAGDQEAERGFQIKYYTFLSTYQIGHSTCDIVNLPLSRKENGRFLPAAFDDIRNLAKRGNDLERFASEDKKKWWDRLAQYGIYHNEWELIEKLNSNEDGLSKYFSTLKTSDSVINELILPRIEGKYGVQRSSDDSSLETMLISYAAQYSRQKDVIREREFSESFLNRLIAAKSQAEELWKNNDVFEQRIAALFSYLDAITKEIDSKEAETAQLQEKKNEAEEARRHIHWERASAEYYTRKEELDRETARYEVAQREKQQAESDYEQAEKRLRLVECAGYHSQLKDIQGRLAGILASIAEKESNEENGHKLAALKYSAFSAVARELERVCLQVSEYMQEQSIITAKCEAIETEISTLQSRLHGLQTDVIKAEAHYEQQSMRDDDLVATLDIPAARMLDGRFQTEELQAWQESTQKQAESFEKGIEAAEKTIAELDARKEAIPQEKADMEMEVRRLRSELDDLNRQVDAYQAAEDTVRAVCNQYSLDFEMRFTESHKDYLTEQISKTEASIRGEEQTISWTEETLLAVDQKTLHIPKRVAEFLADSGIEYMTVEDYLLEQQERGILSKERVGELLSAYPYAAYGIITDLEGLTELQEEAKENWLPSVLPVLTKADLEDVLGGNGKSFSAVSALAWEYFQDCESYRDKLNRSLAEAQTERERFVRRLSEFKVAVATVEAFLGYGESWLDQTNARKEKADAEKEQLQEKIHQLSAEFEELKAAIKRKRKEKEELSERLRTAQNQLRSFDDLVEGLAQEEKLISQLEISRSSLRELKKELDDKTKAKLDLRTKLQELTGQLKSLDELQRKLQAASDSIGKAEETEVLPGNWDFLYGQYETLLAQQSADLKQLNDKKNDLIREKNDKERELRKRNCQREEYEGLYYSEELEEHATEDSRRAKKTFSNAQDAFEKAISTFSSARTSMEAAQNGLSSFGGEALPPGSIGGNFDERLEESQSRLQKLNEELELINRRLSSLRTAKGRAEDAVEHYTRPVTVRPVSLEQDYNAQLKRLKREATESEKTVKASERDVALYLEDMAKACGDQSTDLRLAVTNMRSLISDTNVRGDRYYTLLEHIDANMHSIKLRISQIETDLAEFDKTKQDLVRQCVLQGKQMYEGLRQLSASSKVKVQEKRHEMIRFIIPPQINEDMARASVTAEIEKGTVEITEKMASGDGDDAAIKRIAKRTVGSDRLLRRYISMEEIILKAYKIDSNPENSGYRTWEQTQVNSSGAEKFVVYFAVILALMAYARDNMDEIGSKGNTSVLVLDNPFGPISSKHMLEPMFAISRNYRVQMICLSDLSKSDIVSCFDLVIRAVVRKMSLSTREQLTHEGDEAIEHGFYRSEQMNLF